MKFILAGLVAVASATIIDDAEFRFMEYISTQAKSYGSADEYALRFKFWSAIDQEITTHNADSTQTHKLGHNLLSDMTPLEKKSLLGFKKNVGATKNVQYLTGVHSNSDSVDWRDEGAVTAVKDQAACGSCWSFSSTGALEGAYQIAGNTLTSFSEQQLMDCSYSFGNLSCGGGLMDGAFGYYEVNKAMTEADYPYTASFHRVCSYDDSKAVSGTMISSYYDVVEDPDQLKAALNIAPVSVAIEADTTVFSSYVSGVITSASCGTNLDHGVLAVGYGTLDGDEFFLVKNSWGASWGDEGYVRIGVASGAGICGINSSASQPTL